jgi:hypothetical protein
MVAKMNKAMNLPGIAFALLLAVAILPSTVLATDSDLSVSAGESNRSCTWVGLGCGLSSLGSPGGHWNISHNRGNILFGLRGTASSGGSYMVADRDNDYDTTGDLALLVGLTRRYSRVILSVSTGLSGMRGTFHEKDPANSDWTIKSDYNTVLGLPFEAQLVWRLGNKAGLGLYGYANINSNRNHGGLCLALIFGKI